MVRKIFWVYIIVLGLVMVWLIPPFQKADEVIHFENTSVIIGGKTGMIQKRILDLPEKLKVTDVAFKYDKKINIFRVWDKDDSETFVPFGYLINWKSYISYFPVEIGVWLGSLSPYPVMALYAGRMAGMILFLICIWVALKIIDKKYAGLVMAYAMIPMVIHQVTEVSYDVFLLCLAPVILAAFIKKKILLLAVLSGLFILVKPGYYPMIMILVVLLWQKYQDLLIKKPWIVGVVVLSCIPLILGIIRFLNINAVGSGYQVEILKHDPIILFRIIADTWEAKKDFYLTSGLGYFGWLDYQYDFNQFLVIFGLIVTMVIGVIRKIRKPIIDWFGWMVITGIIFGTYLLIEMGMWMQWTAIGSTVVEGVQGRYLLPLVPILLFWLTQFWVLAGKKRASVIVFGLVMLFIGWGTVDKINKRYYDMSNNFANKDEYKKNFEEAKFISSKDKLTKYFHTSDNDVIGGFEFVLNRNDDKIKVPYRYAIKDGECKKELSWGYLDVSKINKEQVYLQKIDYLKPGFADICFEIEPIVKKDTEKYFDYVENNDEVLVRLMYISPDIQK